MLPRQAKNVESLANYLYEWVSINEINWEFKTTERNKSDIRLHIEPLIGEKKITEISPTDIERLYKQLRTQHNLSDYSVLRIHVLLKTAFKRALILRRIYVNPMESVLKPVVRDKAKKTLSELDVSKLLELVDTKSEMWAALWWVTLLTGLRQGEVLALTWENLDLDSGKLTVTSQIQRQTGNGLCLKSLKQTGTSRRKSKERSIYLDRDTLIRLKFWKLTQNKARLSALSWDERNFIFTNFLGGPLEPRRACAKWKELLKEANIPHIKLHGARTTFTTLAIRKGLDVKTVSHYLGHSDLRTTMDVYLQVTEESLIEAKHRIESITQKVRKV
jgi:integrase